MMYRDFLPTCTFESSLPHIHSNPCCADHTDYFLSSRTSRQQKKKKKQKRKRKKKKKKKKKRQKKKKKKTPGKRKGKGKKKEKRGRRKRRGKEKEGKEEVINLIPAQSLDPCAEVLTLSGSLSLLARLSPISIRGR
jgi:chromatin remodeling complex protein RSC6